MNTNVVLNGRFLGHRITGVERSTSEVLSFIGDRLRWVRPAENLRGVSGHAWEQLILPRRLRKNETLWSPTNTGPLAITNQVLTIHDLSPLEHPEWFVKSFQTFYRLLSPLLILRVKTILVPTEFIRRKILTRFSLPEGKVILAPNGVNSRMFHPINPTPAKDYYHLPDQYILFVGSLQPRKNLNTLIRAWQFIQSEFADVALVIAGSTEPAFRPITWPDRIRQIQFLGYVPDYLLPPLYAGALIFVQPSYDEGFGLTVLESMACGTPVIASCSGALAETIGDAGILIHPSDYQGLSDALAQCLRDQELLESLRQRGLERADHYTWQNTAEIIWAALTDRT